MKDIEILATSIVKQQISLCERLKANITEGDRGISIDGYVTIFKSGHKKKENVIGKVDVQVKGHETENLIELTYPIDTSDLTVYLKYGGCIFFVVAIDKKNNSKIFYKTLSPEFIKINRTKIQEQKTISIKFDIFPIEVNEIENLFLNVYKDFEKQHSFKNLKPLQISDIKKCGIIQISRYSFDNKGVNNINDFLLSEGNTFYYKVDEFAIEQPISGFNKISQISYTDNFPIYINDKKYYDGCKRIIEKGKMTIKIGKSLSLVFEDKKSNILEYNFKSTNYICDFIKDSEFIIDLFKYKHFSIEFSKNNKKTIPFNAIFPLDYEKLIEQYNYIKRIYNSLNTLDFNINFDLSELNNGDYMLLENLCESINNNVAISFNNYEYSPVQIFNFSKYKVLAFVDKVDNNKYLIKNISNINREFVCEINNNKVKTTVYDLFDIKTLSEICNLNYVDIFNRLLEINDFDQMNDFSVNLIASFDINSNKEYLFLARKILNWILNFDLTAAQYHFIKLNLIQIKLRLNESLTSDDIDYLNSIIYNDNNELFIRVGATLLINNKRKFEELFEMMDFDKKESLVKMPIYKRFYEQLR